MNDEALLQSARLYQHDYQSGKKGYTLAAVRLVEKDGVIQSVRRNTALMLFSEELIRIGMMTGMTSELTCLTAMTV